MVQIAQKQISLFVQTVLFHTKLIYIV